MTQAAEQQPHGREEERLLKIEILSDPHLEHGGTIPPHIPESDDIVLAGKSRPDPGCGPPTSAETARGADRGARHGPGPAEFEAAAQPHPGAPAPAQNSRPW